MILRKPKRREGTLIVLYRVREKKKNPCASGPILYRPALFKIQLHIAWDHTAEKGWRWVS